MVQEGHQQGIKLHQPWIETLHSLVEYAPNLIIFFLLLDTTRVNFATHHNSLGSFPEQKTTKVTSSWRGDMVGNFGETSTNAQESCKGIYLLESFIVKKTNKIQQELILLYEAADMHQWLYMTPFRQKYSFFLQIFNTRKHLL